jgi:predicted alpha/beta superfamily hydrolase
MKATVFLLLVTLCSPHSFGQAQQIGDSQPFILGETDAIQSRILSEKRVLNIYLPEGYDDDDTLRYPVVYLLDGSADEDFIHVVGLYQFSSFPWVNRAPKSIIVGIANVDRKRDFTFPSSIAEEQKRYPTAGKSNLFIQFIKQELQPYIEQKFKTNHSRTIIGESLGGLLATEILLREPRLFNQYIIISPSLWWDNGSLLEAPSSLLEKSFTSGTSIYIGVGKEGLTPSPAPRVMEVDANLLAEKIRSSKSDSVHVYFDYLPQENHATIAHQAVMNALRLIYTGNVKDQDN